jgi:tripartite-type tricarboxylate transporter receptor subunit TctC
MTHASPRTLFHRRMGLLALGMGLGLLAAPAAWAQTYPARPIQLVVAAPAGGPSDNLARSFAEGLAKELGQPVLIDNKPGAGGLIGAEAAKRAAPDGYTLHMSWIGNATSKALNPKSTVDINRDFVHITQMVYGANILVANPASGIRSLQDLMQQARSRPGQLNYASAGSGSSGHLAMEMLKQRAGLNIVHVPYKGGGPALTDVLGGQIPIMFINQDAVIPHMATGKLVPLAITSPVRNAIFPNLPTIAEAGQLPGFEATAWAGISAPQGTPRSVINRLHAASMKVMQDSFRSKQEALGAVVVASTPEQFTAFVQKETDNWTQVITKAGIQAD